MVWQYNRRTRLYNKRNKRELLRIKSRRVWQQVSLGVLLLTFIWGGITAFWPKTTATPASAAAPTITSISPNSGPTTGGTTITITGSGFAPSAAEMTDISVGSAQTCGIYKGKAYCWGGNYGGQLGNSSTVNSSIPVAVDTSSMRGTVTAIASGGNFTCAIADGKAYCWGANGQGQLGNNSIVQSSVPVAVSGVLANAINVTAISTGDYSACAIADGKAYCWGSNGSGVLGDGSTTDSSVPVAVSGVLANATNVTAISTSGYVTCAVAGGKAYCWGQGSQGQLGNNSTTGSVIPVAVDTSKMSGTVRAISTGGGSFTTCAISDGQAYCWGSNSRGQLGNNSINNSSVPEPVNTLNMSGTVTAITTGMLTTCAIADGKAYCWGKDEDYGQLGNSSITQSLVPIKIDGILANATNVTAISTYFSRAVTCAIADGKAYCWGYNNYGQLGNGSTTDSSVLVAVDTTNIPLAQLSTVTLDNQTCTDLTIISDTQATCVTPAHATGAANVVMANDQDQSVTLASGFTYTYPDCASSECFAFTIDTRLDADGNTTNTSKTFAISTAGQVGVGYNSYNSYNWIIDWGDGTPMQTASGTGSSNGNISHTYANAGQYQIAIRPNGTATSGWLNAFMVVYNYYNNSSSSYTMFLSIDTPLTNLMRTQGASNRFASMFYGAVNAVGIPDDLFAHISTAGDTDFSGMFSGTFSNFASHSTTATIPAGLFNSLDTSSGTDFDNMFSGTFSGFASNSTTATIPAGLFDSLDTSNGTDFGNMFNGAFGSFAYNSPIATIPAGLFDSLDTSNGTDFGNMFDGAFGSFAYNSPIATIPAGLFNSLNTSNTTNFIFMFHNAFAYFAYNSEIATIPAGLFDSLDTGQGTEFSWMFGGAFQYYAYNSPTATIPAGLFDSLDTSHGTGFVQMFVMTFYYCANSSTSATIPSGLFDSLNTSKGEWFDDMFNYTFAYYAPNSTVGTVPSGLFDHIDTSSVTSYNGTSYPFFAPFYNYATRTADFVIDGEAVAPTQTFSSPYSTMNISTGMSNGVVNPGDKVKPIYSTADRTIFVPAGYEDYDWYYKDGTSCATTDPTPDCGPQNSTTLATFASGANSTEWTPDTPTEKGNVTFYGALPAVVTFNTNGGSAVSSQTVDLGDLVAKPTDPTRSGYLFGGWYADDTCTAGDPAGCLNAWDFAADPATGDMTLFAKWIASSLTLDIAGGDAVISLTPDLTGTAASTISAATNNPAGYQLNIQADCNQGNINAGHSLADGTCASNNRLMRVKNLSSDNGSPNYFINPTAPGALSTNSWGYQLGSEPNSSAWLPVPTTATELAATAGANADWTTAAAGTPDSYNIIYGANVSASQPAGTYRGQVIYTLVANP